MTGQDKNRNQPGAGESRSQAKKQRKGTRPHNPHDALFRALLSDRRHAKAFVKEHLPRSIADRMADALPEIVDGSFLDEDLNRSQADLLLKISMISGDSQFVFAVAEHKSKPDSDVLLQVLAYICRVCASVLEGDAAKVVALVTYTGNQDWDGPTNFCQLFGFDKPDPQNFVPDWPIVFVNLKTMSVEQLSRLASLKVGLLILTGRAHKHLEVLEEMAQTDSNWQLRSQLITYTHGVYRSSKAEEVIMNLIREGNSMEETYVETLAYRQKAEGIQVGEKRGEKRGVKKGESMRQAANTLQLLERRFGPLSQSVKQRISNASLDQLNAWFDRAIDAESLDAALGQS